MIRTLVVILLGTVVSSAPMSWLGNARISQAVASSVRTISWKDLVPAGYDPSELINTYNREASALKDNDPRAAQLAEKYRKLWEQAPVVESLNDATVQLAGFLVTLEGDGKAVSEFLLVPYFGACIHVPPPPSNQVVLVRTGAKPFKVDQMFQQVAVTGRLRTQASRNDLASSSYVIEATLVEARAPARPHPFATPRQ